MITGENCQVTSIGARRKVRGLATLGGILAFVGVCLFASAAPASAHTALVETIPENRETLGEPPEELTIVFAEPVDPESVRIQILTLEGAALDGATRVTPDSPDSAVIVFDLPELPNGIYGIPWQTIGPDGHRVAGEVVIGVGLVDPAALESASFVVTPALDRVLEVGAVSTRYLFYLGLALFVGSLWLFWWWQVGRRADTTAPVCEQLIGGAGLWLRVGAVLIMMGVAGRSVTATWSVARGLDGDSSTANLASALGSRTGLAGLVAIGAAVVVLLIAPRSLAGGRRSSFGLAAVGVLATTAAGAVNGHTALLSDSALGIWVSVVHVVGAAVWVGPVAVFALVSMGRTWRRLASPARAQLAREVFGAFAPWALVAFVLIILSGLQSSLLTVGGSIFQTRYGAILTLKLVVVVVILVPIGIYHDSIAGWLGARRASLRRSKVLGVTLGVEAASMAVVLVLAAILTTTTPGSIGGATPKRAAGAQTAVAELLSEEAVSDVSVCAGRTVGQANCYRDFLADLMRREGAAVAVAEVQRLSETDEFVSADCHQVAHDLGNDAAAYYGDLGVALSHEGSACWSGYYHGVVEYTLAAFEDDRLLAEIPSVCAGPAQDRYSFTHYNCVHGVGHGVMLRLEADLFASIPFCERLADEWEVSVCLGGLFMENIISAQQGAFSPTLDGVDLIYPCNAVDPDYVDECFSMQTSWILWQLDYDFEAAFRECDSVAAAMVDDCYRSMGRDVSGTSRLVVDQIVGLCSLGDPAFQVECFVGASQNAVYNDHDIARATELCAAVPESMRSRCLDARDQAHSTL